MVYKLLVTTCLRIGWGHSVQHTYGMMTPQTPAYPQTSGHQQFVHRQPMTTWNPPVYNSNPTIHQETMQWSNAAPTPVFKQESFKVEPQEQQLSEQQHGNDNEFQHLFSPLKYLNDLDCVQQYQGLG